MKKKILCVIMSAVMLTGLVIGCGSSDKNYLAKSDKESTESIMAEIIPGKSTVEELENYLQENGVIWENNANGEPDKCSNTDYFLGHEAQFSEFTYKKGIVYSYRVDVSFNDVNDYKKGLEEIKEYFEKMGTGITGYNDDEGGDKEPIKCYLLEDETDHYTAVMPWVSTYDEVEGKYYNSILQFVYYRVDKNNVAGEVVLWNDKDGNSYTTKFDKAKADQIENTESATGTIVTTLQGTSDWRQTYIEYFNKLDSTVGGYQIIDINNDGYPEIFYYCGDGRQTEAVFLHIDIKGNLNIYKAAAHGGDQYGFSYNSNMLKCEISENEYKKCIYYKYDKDTRSYNVVFDGQCDKASGSTPAKYYINDAEVSNEQYVTESKRAAGDAKYNLPSYYTNDIVSAIKNY